MALPLSAGKITIDVSFLKLVSALRSLGVMLVGGSLALPKSPITLCLIPSAVFFLLLLLSLLHVYMFSCFALSSCNIGAFLSH